MMRQITRYSLTVFLFVMLTAQAPSPFDIDGLTGKKAPDFVLKDLNGNNVSLSSLRGSTVLINFWATWCPPCKAEMPSLNKLYSAHKSKGLVVLAISTDKNASPVKEFLAKNKFEFLILLDPDGKVSKQFKVFSIPTSFLIDRQGVIVQKYLGEEEWDSPAIRNKIKELL